MRFGAGVRLCYDPQCIVLAETGTLICRRRIDWLAKKGAMMNSRLRVAVFLTSVALCLLATTALAQKRGVDCRNMVAGHTYAIYFEGFLNVPQFFQLGADSGWGDEPNAGIGRLTFFPDGTLKNTQTILVGLLGFTQDEPLDGTYTLKWDLSRGPAVCTGSMIEADGFYNFQLIVSQDGQRLEMIHSDTGLAVNPTGILMNPAGCSNRSIEGSYTHNTRGWGLLPTPVPADQTLGGYIGATMSGAFRFYPGTAPSGTFVNSPLPGAAAVKGWDLVSINGTIIRRTMSGWYKINRDCSGTIVVNDNMTPEFIIEAYVGKEGDKVALLNVNSVDLGDGPIPTFLMPIPLDRTLVDDRQ